MRRLCLVLSVALALPVPLPAQTTDTERAAAGAITQQIAALQDRLQPGRSAERLVARQDADRDRVLQRAAELWNGGLQALSDWIGHHPEVGWKEQQAVDTLTKVLAQMGFRIERNVASLETAFVGTWDSPAGTNGPTIGFIGEYNALRGTNGAFHGDQHNAQSPVAMAAAQALAEVMTNRKLPGRIRFYGTPAEEVGPPAKTIMWKAGVFKGADILLRSHSAMSTARGRAGFGVCCLNINEVKYTFKGRPAHQLSSWNGRNALEGAVSFYTAVDRLRSTFRPEASIQGVIPEGGVAPNVVPDRAVVDYYVRYPDEVYLEHITKMMDDAARGAALATGTEVSIDRYGEYRDGVSLGTLEELYFAYARQLGAPALVPDPERPAGYEETGWVTRDIPGLGVSVSSSGSPNHTYGMLDDAFTDVGHTGFRMDAQIMAAVAWDFLTNAQLRADVKNEHGVLAGLLEQYHTQLRAVYEKEIGPGTSR